MTSVFRICVVIQTNFLNWLTQCGFKNAFYLKGKEKKENHSCSVIDSHAKLCALRVRCVEVNLAKGGNPTGWQMVREEAVLDRRFWFTVTPAADGRKCPAQALGQVMEGGGDRRWHWGVIPPDERPWTFVLFAVLVFSRSIRGFLLGRVWEWSIAVQ